MDYLDPLWKVLERNKKIDLWEAVKEAGLNKETVRTGVVTLLKNFTKKWEWLGKTTLTKKGFQKKMKELADSEMFYSVMLLYKCRDTPPDNPIQGGGLPLFFKKLTEVRYLTLNHPTYDNLVEARNGKLP